DANVETYMAPDMEGPTFLDLRLKTPRSVNAILLRLYNVELYPERFDILLREPGSREWRSVVARRVTDRRHIGYYFPPTTVERIRIQTMRYHGQDRFVVADLAVGHARQPTELVPEFGSYTTPIFPMNSSWFRVRLGAPAQSKGGVFVIYRY